MNKDSLQEKFQVTTAPSNDENKEPQWDTFPLRGSSNRSIGDAGFMHRNNDEPHEIIGVKFNFLPPGMDIGNQRRALIPHSKFVLAGLTDVSPLVTPEALDPNVGYTRLEMKATDDQYTGEHMDHFYGIAYGTDPHGKVVEGFTERNNYLDRE